MVFHFMNSFPKHPRHYSVIYCVKCAFHNPEQLRKKALCLAPIFEVLKYLPNILSRDSRGSKSEKSPPEEGVHNWDIEEARVRVTSSCSIEIIERTHFPIGLIAKQLINNLTIPGNEGRWAKSARGVGQKAPGASVCKIKQK